MRWNRKLPGIPRRGSKSRMGVTRHGRSWTGQARFGSARPGMSAQGMAGDWQPPGFEARAPTGLGSGKACHRAARRGLTRHGSTGKVGRSVTTRITGGQGPGAHGVTRQDQPGLARACRGVTWLHRGKAECSVTKRSARVRGPRHSRMTRPTEAGLGNAWPGVAWLYMGRGPYSSGCRGLVMFRNQSRNRSTFSGVPQPPGRAPLRCSRSEYTRPSNSRIQSRADPVVR